MSKPAEAKTLAKRIRESVGTETTIDQPLKTSETILGRITDGIYRQPASALRELISNAYDADATEVQILTDAPRFSQITIRDNGIGFSPEILEHMVLNIGGSAKRTDDAVNLKMANQGDTTHSAGGRKYIGKMGIGLFSVAQFTRHFVIVTKAAGDDFQTVADITLGGDVQNADDQGEITAGEARIWTERAVDKASHGTEVRLCNLLPRTRAELCSTDWWSAIQFEVESDNVATTQPPLFHIGRVDQNDPDHFSLEPNLPWGEHDAPLERMLNLVGKVQVLAVTDKNLVDIDRVLDKYLQTLWSLSLSAPLDYIAQNPFDVLCNADRRLFRLENKTRGQAVEITPPKKGGTPRKVMDLKSPYRRGGDAFKVYFDGVELRRPVLFMTFAETQNAVQDPLLFVGKCREEFPGKPINLSRGPLEFEAYLFWAPKILPTQHQGVLLRVGDAAGAGFDRTFMGYQISEQTRLRQITAEIFVNEGLDGAINLDRESFNFSHPHYQFLTKWLHSALRQLTNRHKEIGAQARLARKAEEGTATQGELNKLVGGMLHKRGVEDTPAVQLVDMPSPQVLTELREKGVVALRKAKVIPASTSKQTVSELSRVALHEQKAIAITQILQSWGLLDGLSFDEQEILVSEILAVMVVA